MDLAGVVEIANGAIEAMIALLAPALLVILVLGLLLGILQAATQVNESAVAFVPKVLALLVFFMLAGPLLLRSLVDYTRSIIERIPSLIG
ncbi:MAG: flagellar type III secretion system protein FliQ [Betaproteobacteria bacterium]|jgi:flagellar biosynthetic protein FliQ|nr:flagellar type III secretion system protein FliQ [Betaproteobacteria bacterium]NBY17049.1 flagellar type III secretion system protein FliQ [Betaproteobacteria bacterium]